MGWEAGWCEEWDRRGERERAGYSHEGSLTMRVRSSMNFPILYFSLSLYASSC